jgi:hypothetical protein
MRRRLGLMALLSLMAMGIFADRADAGAPITYNVTIGSPLSYVFNGGANDPVLTLAPGQTYIFTMTAGVAAAHPFFISTTTAVEPPTAFVDPGLTGNGTATVTFTVPTGTIPPLFYQCSVHSFMTNQILVAPFVPAMNGMTKAGLAALLLAAGVGAIVWQQRRKRTFTPAA